MAEGGKGGDVVRGGGGVVRSGEEVVRGGGGGVRGGRGEGGVRDGGVGVSGEGRADGGRTLHQCRSCGLDCGTTAALYRHVAVQCLEQLGESLEEFRRKHKLQQKHLRYLEQAEERRAQARQQVTHSPHLILGTFGQSSLNSRAKVCWNMLYEQGT